MGFIVPNETTLVGFGGLNLTIILFLFGLIFTSILVIKNVQGGLVIGIMATSILSLIVSHTGYLAEGVAAIPKELFSFPAFLTVILIPLTYSITQGVIWGVLSYTLIKVLLGKAKDIHWMLYIINLFSILSLI